LKNLNLNFAKCFKIEPEGFKSIVTALADMKPMDVLKLNFNECIKVETSCIEYLNKCLVQFGVPIEFGLNLKGLSNVT